MNITNRAAQVLTVLSVAAGLIVSSPAPQAAAGPDLPDFGSFAAVPVEDYLVTYIRGRRIVAFSTPYSLMCDFDAPVDPADPPTPRLHCAGDLPGTTIKRFSSDQSPPPACTAGTVDAAPSGGYEFMPYDWKCGDINFRLDDFPYWSGRLLDRGEKLSYGNITCAVGDDNLVACLDTSGGQHGFAIQPSGSRAF